MTTISRVEHITPALPQIRPVSPGRVGKSGGEDTITISPEGYEKAELLHAFEMVSQSASTPEVRPDRVEAARQKINDPGYLSQAIEGAAGDIVDMIFG